MKKTFVTLLVSAVAVWGYVAVQIVMAMLGRSGDAAAHRTQASSPALALSRARVALDTSFRDPFLSYLYAQKPAPIAAPAKAGKPALKLIDPPKAVLSGVLWGDEPVAILKQDGQTELVKKGAAVWDLKVLSIDRNKVVVEKQGRRFTLDY